MLKCILFCTIRESVLIFLLSLALQTIYFFRLKPNAKPWNYSGLERFCNKIYEWFRICGCQCLRHIDRRVSLQIICLGPEFRWPIPANYSRLPTSRFEFSRLYDIIPVFQRIRSVVFDTARRSSLVPPSSTTITVSIASMHAPIRLNRTKVSLRYYILHLAIFLTFIKR